MVLVCSTTREIVLKFASDITFIDYAIDLIRTLATYQGMGEPSRVLLVSNELLRNAVVHGNRNDTEKLVSYRLELLDDGRCRVEVEDRGEGFDAGRAAGPLRCARPHGHGFGAIGELSEAVEFNAKGNRVTVYLEV